MKLALPFALVATAPFIMLGLPMEAAAAAISMGLAGTLMPRKAGWPVIGCTTAVLGGIAGLCLGNFAWGVMLGVLALFPLRLVAWAAEGGIARRGSLIDEIDARQAWTVAAVLVTIVPSPLAVWAPELPGLHVAFAVGQIVLVFVTALDARDFFALARLQREAALGVAAPLTPVARDVPLADVGVGNRQHERRLPGAVYRGSAEVIAVIRGDARAARRLVGGRLFLDGALVAAVAVILRLA